MPQSSFDNVTPDELVKIQRGTTFTNALGLDLAQWRQKKNNTQHCITLLRNGYESNFSINENENTHSGGTTTPVTQT